MTRIFINYRRQDTGALCDALYERLAGVFGRNNVFRDLQSIHPGDDFPDVIAEAVKSSDLLVALVGEQWLTLLDGNGQRRIDDPRDFVRSEIATALRQNVPVIPILAEGAQMPTPEELPLNVSGMTRRNTIQLGGSTFESDVDRITQAARDIGAKGRRASPEMLPTELTGTWVSSDPGDALLQYDFHVDGTYEFVGVIQQARPAGTFLFQVYHAGAVRISRSSLQLLPFRSDASLQDPELPERNYTDKPRSVEGTSFEWKLVQSRAGPLLTLSDTAGSTIAYRHP